MNDTTYNAIKEAEIIFTDFSYDGKRLAPRNNSFYNDIQEGKFIGAGFLRIWHFDIVEYYTTLLRDEFGILSLESRIEKKELASCEEYRIYVNTEMLLDYIADAIAQEMEIEKPFYIVARNNEIHISGFSEDFDKFARVNDMTDEILARADYLGAMDAVKVAVCLKGPKAA